MTTSPNIKKARSVVITIALVVATNFAISHAESMKSILRSNEKVANQHIYQNISIVSGEIGTPPGPRPKASIASGEIGTPPGPRPERL